ncbi:MAG TPA: hypothetical protein VJH69_01560 [Candidatus Paceibacterota bacterium]
MKTLMGFIVAVLVGIAIGALFRPSADHDAKAIRSESMVPKIQIAGLRQCIARSTCKGKMIADTLLGRKYKAVVVKIGEIDFTFRVFEDGAIGVSDNAAVRSGISSKMVVVVDRDGDGEIDEVIQGLIAEDLFASYSGWQREFQDRFAMSQIYYRRAMEMAWLTVVPEDLKKSAREPARKKKGFDNRAAAGRPVLFL